MRAAGTRTDPATQAQVLAEALRGEGAGHEAEVAVRPDADPVAAAYVVGRPRSPARGPCGRRCGPLGADQEGGTLDPLPVGRPQTSGDALDVLLELLTRSAQRLGPGDTGRHSPPTALTRSGEPRHPDAAGLPTLPLWTFDEPLSRPEWRAST